MTKEIEVDVEKSLEFNKANGRLKSSDRKEMANFKRKTYICPKCQSHYVIQLREFGETEVCPKCRVPMKEVL